MKLGYKIALGVVGGVAVIGVGVVVVAMVTGPHQQGPTGGPKPSTFAHTAADLAGMSAMASQEYRRYSTGGGSASGGASADTHDSGSRSQYS